MLRYLHQAFWARPQLSAIGRVPWNALAVAGAAILGFGEHAVWLAALGLETVYLYALATNPRFQHWVDAKDVEQIQADSDQSRRKLVEALNQEQKRRLDDLEQRCGKVDKLYRESQSEDFLYDSNREAMRRLTWLYLRLLVAQRNLQVVDVTTRRNDLEKQITTCEADLAKTDLSPALRESKKATLAILKQRIRNLQRRNETLAEIESDLTRIEQQIDLAVEDATLKERPTAISANIDLVSHLLEGEDAEFAPLGETTSTSASRGSELEN
jgi:hypothetical protein